MHSSLFAAVVLGASQAFALVRSPAPTESGGRYVVGGYSFANRILLDFTTGSFPSNVLRISTWNNDELHGWDAANVDVSGGYLNLRVPGGQTSLPYKGGEVATIVDNILYASVRTVAIFSEPLGVCNGIFLYGNSTQETDIEWLSDPASLSNQGTRKLWLTNQDANRDGARTSNGITPPANPTSEEHEYRIDWTPGLVQWFVDGAEVWRTTSDVPSAGGPWLFNNWSNGDEGWSVGPPATNANFRVKDSAIYYNTGPRAIPDE